MDDDDLPLLSTEGTGGVNQDVMCVQNINVLLVTGRVSATSSTARSPLLPRDSMMPKGFRIVTVGNGEGE